MRDLSILLVHLGATLAQLTGPNATPADDEGNRVIDGSSCPLLVNLTVPLRFFNSDWPLLTKELRLSQSGSNSGRVTGSSPTLGCGSTASVAAGGMTFDDGLGVRQVPFHPRPCAPLDDRAQQALEKT